MKTSCIVLVLLFSALLADHEVVASHLRREEEEDQRQDERESGHGTIFFATYKNKRGHRIARQCAQKVLQDWDDDKHIIFEGSAACLEQLAKDDDIEEIDIDYTVQQLGTGFVDPSRTLEEIYPWGLEMIQANQMENGMDAMTICIVDTGIAIGHPDFLADRITGDDVNHFTGLIMKWNEDHTGHGTHVAGTIAALSDSKGVAGAGNFRLHITRGLRDDGTGYESDVRAAVQQCVQAGAQIINLSLGGPYMSHISKEFYRYVVEDLGIMIVAAAGNDGSTGEVFPAAHPNVISVAAVDQTGVRWGNSNFGDQIEFAAPGVNIYSTSVQMPADDEGGSTAAPEYTYTVLSGTSLASPHVAAAAALIWSNHPECTNDHIRYVMALTADKPRSFCDDLYGYGIVQASTADDWFFFGCDWPVPHKSQGGCTTL